MTDFLTRLAHRTLGLIPVVQPRQASRYAPAIERMIVSDYDWNSVSEVKSDSNVAPPGLLNNTPTPPAIVDVNASDAVDPPDYSSSLIKQLSDSSTNQLSPRSQLTTPQLKSLNSDSIQEIGQPVFITPTNSQAKFSQNPFNVSQNQSEPLRPEVESSLSAAPPQQKYPEIQTDRGGTERAEPQQVDSPSRFSSLTSPEQNLQEREINLPLVRPATPPGLLTTEETQSLDSAPLLINPPGNRPTTPSTQSISGRPPALISPDSPPEPSIEIHIGRVEVRTTPKTSQARPEKTASKPALSLQDYLNQRDGGKV